METDYNDYDREINDTDEITGTDIKINPDYYIHLSLVKLTKTFDKNTEFNESIEMYRHIVEHIEILAYAANIIDEEYNKELNTFMDSEAYKNEPNTRLKNIKLARKKLSLMMKEAFSSKTVSNPLNASK